MVVIAMIMNASAELKPTAFRVKKPRRDDRLDERVTSLLVVKPGNPAVRKNCTAAGSRTIGFVSNTA
jgi:hypothetical protein